MFTFLQKLFNFKKERVTDYYKETLMKKFLIVGLGNIGPKYKNTRHNIGFKMLDFLAEKESLEWESVRLGELTTYKKKGRTFLLLKPSTYMNLSGKAVKYWLEKEKIPFENLLIIADDINLSFGTFRLKPKGSDGDIYPQGPKDEKIDVAQAHKGTDVGTDMLVFVCVLIIFTLSN